MIVTHKFDPSSFDYLNQKWQVAIEICIIDIVIYIHNYVLCSTKMSSVYHINTSHLLLSYFLSLSHKAISTLTMDLNCGILSFLLNFECLIFFILSKIDHTRAFLMCIPLLRFLDDHYCF